jgi:hypothetical protein
VASLTEAAVQASVGRGRPPDLFERADELDLLRQPVDGTRAGVGAFALIVGRGGR